MTAVLIVSLLVSLLALDALYLWYRRSGGFALGLSPLRPFAPASLPQGVFLHSGHSWARPNVDGEVHIGLDELLVQALGSIDRVELPTAGATVERGARVATVWRDGRKLTIRSPVSGTIQRANNSLKRCPLQVTNDPYGAGWLATVAPDHAAHTFQPLLVGGEALRWLKEETQRFVDFMARSSSPTVVGFVLADGAHPIVGSALDLDEDAWERFELKFIATPKH